MPYRFDGPEFSVIVEGRFVAPRLWLIHAVIDYRPHLSFDAGRRVAPEARIELLRGMIREARCGWDRGAASVRVLIEGDHQVAGFFEILNRYSVPAISA